MHEFPCPDPISVDVRIAAGSVELHAEPRETAVADVEPYDDGDAAVEAAAATRVEFSGDTLRIIAPEPSGWLLRRTPRLRVTVRVPAGSSGRCRTASADIAGTGDWERVTLKTASGDASVEQVAGDLTVNTASGDVRVDQVGGELTVRTASGDVSARRVAGTVDVTSASGNVQVDHAGADARLKTASGNATVGAARQGTVQASAVSGDVTVGVVSGTGVWLDLNTVAGKTHSDLSMGGGGGEPTHELTVRARTVSGNINVHRVTLPATA